MREIIQAISQARDSEVEEMMMALIKRYKELFPDWELSIVAVEKTGDRNAQIDKVIELLEKLKE